MLDSLCDHLLEKPSLYIDEMVVLLWDEFQMLVTPQVPGGLSRRKVGLKRPLDRGLRKE